MNINNKDEPNTAPKPDQWYNLTLGSSFKEQNPSSKFCTLRYEFKPASIDKNQSGKLHKNKENRVTVEFQNSQPGKPKVSFEGSSEDYKENDAVLFFDGETFRLERLHRAVKRLKHVRLPGESATVSASASTFASATAETSSPPVVKAPNFQSQNNVVRALPIEVERIEVGDIKSSDTRPKNEKAADYPSSHANQSNASPEAKSDDLDEQLDILNDDVEGDTAANGGGDIIVKEIDTGIDINIPHHNDTDDEIADVDASDDDDKGRNAAEELRAQVNAEERGEHTSSSSSSSGSESSGSSSSSSSSTSRSRSASDSGSSDSESSDAETVNSI
nr:lisH domain-containing protein C1711.05-like [Ipomoea batatas]GME17539.1 lisH domain-containing protein C1711.05-like [Ipomoea batatas]